MVITKVDVHKVEKEDSRLRGIATVYLDDCFVIKNIRIIDGDNGLFIAMPNREIAPNKHVDICNPINKETRKMFEDAKVVWQTAELGKVDVGGGGTVAMFIAKHNIETVDLGVPVIAMHAPYEIIAKTDLYEAARAFGAFFR